MEDWSEQMKGGSGTGFLTPVIGVGASDLQHAVRAEVRRIMEETKGDPLAQSQLLTERLRDLRLITDPEVDVLNRLAEIGYKSGAAKGDAKGGYFQSRDLYNSLLASGRASPVALALASSAVGSYSITENPDEPGGVIFKKSNGAWQDRLGKAGAVIGAAWGPMGAAIGGEIGGAVGAAVDECLK